MFVIRKKDNPKVIKAWGYTLKPGGLGEFDPDEFEEVNLDELPKDWEEYKEPPAATGEAFIEFLMKAIAEKKINNFTEDTLADFNIALASFDPVLQNVDRLSRIAGGRGFKNSNHLNIYMTKFFRDYGGKLSPAQRQAIQAVVQEFIQTHRFEGK